MPCVLNCLDRENVVQVGGNTFYFKARQIKHIYKEDIAAFITRDRREEGFMGLPDEFEGLCHVKPEIFEKMITADQKSLLEKKRLEGVAAHINQLKQQVHNLKVSLQGDLDKSNTKMDARALATDGDIRAMEAIAKYSSTKDDYGQKRIDHIKELEKLLDSSA